MTTYEAYLANINAYMNSLQETSVKVLFFLASDLKKPKLLQCMKKFSINLNQYFIMFGKDRNFLYVYKPSELKALVKPLPPRPAAQSSKSSLASIYHEVSNAEILNVGHSFDTDVGNHIDFSVNRSRNRPPYVGAHATTYELDNQDLTFTRRVDACNFTLSDENVTNIKTDNIPNINCETRTSIKLPTTLETVFGHPTMDQRDIEIVRHLCKVVTGSRGGTYIELGPEKRRKYIMAGGGPTSYKGLTFMSVDIIEYIGINILSHVGEARKDLDSVQVLYDEGNELDANSNRYCTLIYDFMESRSIYHVDMITLLTACYASKRQEQSPSYVLTSDERAAVAYISAFRRQVAPGRDARTSKEALAGIA